MVIFNIQAIFVALFALLFSVPFFIINYLGWIGDELTMVFVSWMILIASVVGKSMDIVGRLFFIPMWILSIPLPFIITYSLYEWTGIIVTFSILIGPFILILLALITSERKKANNIRMVKPDLPDYNEDPVAYWTAVKKQLFLPTFIKMNPEIAAYNIRVLDEVSKQEIKPSTLEFLKAEMNNVRSHSKKVDKNVVDVFLEEINNLSIINPEDSENSKTIQVES